jgi:hypothetical protein
MKKNKIAKEALAYTAGIIDGEGCIKVYKVDAAICHRPNNRYTLNVQVQMVDRKIVKWLHNLYGGYFYFQKININKYPNCRDRFRWQLQNHHCREFILNILPYLKLKRKQAEEALKFLDLKKGDINKKHKYWLKFKKLNRVGRINELP